MSLDDLFGLFILFAFVVLPLLGRVLRGRTNANRPRPSAQPQQQAPRPVVAALPEDERARSAFEQRLEEARKRVQEAQGQSGTQPTRQTPRRGAAQTSQPSAQTPATVFTPEPTSTTVFTPSVLTSSADAPLLTPSRPQPPAPARSFLPFESETAIASITISKPLEVIRKRRARRAKLPATLLGFEEQDFLRGVIWQQILNEPRAKRPHGRELSRRP